ncbi:hypothetical protein FNJ87_02225 [Nonlabens mediterrranea]|uniref:Uncharacterized protein n=1 Tax=Nonlabens mediterrranea TaxID=1419947 RepID=A0ABS0A233_9FLAO|nr:hypothetical protein [Nonlabens mediterrranea]
MLNTILKVFTILDDLKIKIWELRFKGNVSLSDFSYKKKWNSKKVHRLMYKELIKLSHEDYAFLLRERVNNQLIIPAAFNLLLKEGLVLSLYYKSELAIKQRELIRELLLIDLLEWDYNPSIYFSLKTLIEENLESITLPKEFLKEILNYQPNDLIWNDRYIKEFQGYSNDSFAGVIYAYSLIISRKRAILNGTSINVVDSKSNSLSHKVTNLKDFEDYILGTINVTNELRERLKCERYFEY